MKDLRKLIIDEISDPISKQTTDQDFWLTKMKAIVLDDEVNRSLYIDILANEQLNLEVKKSLNLIKQSSKSTGSQKDMFQTELNKIQAVYASEDENGKKVFVPVMQMSKSQLVAKIAEHRKSGKGEFKHADQLQILLDRMYP